MGISSVALSKSINSVEQEQNNCNQIQRIPLSRFSVSPTAGNQQSPKEKGGGGGRKP